MLPNMRIATVGIVLLILLPVLRVLLMLLVFIRKRDLRFSCIAGLVLAEILLAVLLGFAATLGYGCASSSARCETPRIESSVINPIAKEATERCSLRQ